MISICTYLKCKRSWSWSYQKCFSPPSDNTAERNPHWGSPRFIWIVRLLVRLNPDCIVPTTGTAPSHSTRLPLNCPHLYNSGAIGIRKLGIDWIGFQQFSLGKIDGNGVHELAVRSMHRRLLDDIKFRKHFESTLLTWSALLDFFFTKLNKWYFLFSYPLVLVIRFIIQFTSKIPTILLGPSTSATCIYIIEYE